MNLCDSYLAILDKTFMYYLILNFLFRCIIFAQSFEGCTFICLNLFHTLIKMIQILQH